jgi:dTDP-glucose 4,6-dehydratase
MILNALQGKPLRVYGNDLHVRDWLLVGDHCAEIRAVLEKGKAGKTYNIGGNNQRTNLEVVKTICSILDELKPGSSFVPHANLITMVKDPPGHDRRYAIDAGKIERESQWKPRENFESAIRKTIQWYLNNPAWIKDANSGAYQSGIALNYGNRELI